MLPIKVVSIRVRVIIWPRSKVIHIGYLFAIRRSKGVPYLIMRNYMIKRATPIISRGWGTRIHNIHIYVVKPLSHRIHFSSK